jgi:hypothetical protein
MKERIKAWFGGTTPLYLALALLASAPAWIVKHPPLEDLPFHLSSIRVIHSFGDPQYGFEDHFVLVLGRTSYVFYYLAGSALSYLVGVSNANVALMCVYLGGTPLALRSLLRALRKDERLCILVVPLLTNVMFIFGLLPFVFGVPIMFWTLAAAIRYLEDPTRDRAIVLGVLAVVLFYSHIFPFGLFGIGYAAMFPWTHPDRWKKAIVPLIPTGAAAAWWTAFTKGGAIARGALGGDPKDELAPLDRALGDLWHWTGDIFRDTTDEKWFIVWAFAVLVAVGLAQGERDRARWYVRALVPLPLLCFVLYFTTGQSRGPVWLFAQRFPILCLITLIPLLRMPTGWRGVVATALALVAAAGSIKNTCEHFIKFELDEVGDVDDAIEAIPPRKKVAALVFDKFSAIVNWAPFLHFGSYYQLKKGGVVQFTYAGYAHWPFDFQPGKYPPPGGPARLRWEWTPESIPVVGELYPYYDYVLARGPGFRPPQGTFHLKWRNARWSVWERD